MFTDDDTGTPVVRQLKTCSGLAVASIVSGLTIRRELSIAVVRDKLYDQQDVEAMRNAANFVGAISAGLALYFIGRRWTAILVSAMFILPLLAIASDYGPRTELAGIVTFHIARTQLYAMYSVYAAEATAPKLRGSVISTYYVGYKAGELAGALFEPDSKKLVMVALLVVLAGLALAFRVPDTPHWLTLKRRHQEAAQLFAWLRGGDNVDADELEATRNKLEAPAGGVRALLSAKFYTPLVLFAGLQLAYADSCDLVRPSLEDAVRRYKFDSQDSLSGPVLMGMSAASLFHYVGALLGSIVTVGLCFVTGRRLLFFASTLSGVAIFFVHLFAFVPVKIAIYVSLCCDFFNFLGAEQIILIMPTELFPATLREVGVVTCECITLVVDFIMQWAKKKGLTSLQFKLYYYGRWIFVPLGLFLCLYFLPETKNLPLARSEELGAQLKVQFVESKDEEPE